MQGIEKTDLLPEHAQPYQQGGLGMLYRGLGVCCHRVPRTM